jgi:hypothetical protein
MMKKSLKGGLIAALLLASVTMVSCEKCAECHYDFNDEEVELGEKCGDDLTDLEASGYEVNGTTYEVHCHDH